MRKTLKAGAWWALLVLLLLVAVLASGSLLFFSLSGEEFVAGVLGRVLGRTVQIEDIDVRVGTSIDFEVRGVQIFDVGADPEGADPAFAAKRVSGSQAWPSLLSGQLIPLEWTVVQPVVRLHEGQESTLRFSDLPLSRLELIDATVIWIPRTGLPVFLQDMNVSVRRQALSGTFKGQAVARLTRGERAIGGITARVGGRPGNLQIDMQWLAVDLSSLPLSDNPLSSGVAEGSVTLRLGKESIEAHIDVDINRLQIRLAGWHGPIAPSNTHVRMRGSWKNHILTLEPDPVRLDDMNLTGRLRLDLGPRRHLSGTLSLGPFELGGPRDRLQLFRLLGLRHAFWSRVDRGSEGGQVNDFRLRIDVPLDRLGDTLAFNSRLSSKELRIDARVRDGVYRPYPKSIPLEKISADVHLAGNVLEIAGLEIARDGHAYPKMDIRIDGMHRFAHLPAKERAVPRGPGRPIPGLGPAFRSLSQSGNGEHAPTRIRLTDFDLAFPAFVLPLRAMHGWLTFPDGGVALEKGRGVLGGAPASINVLWNRKQEHLAVNIVYPENETPARAAPPPSGPLPEPAGAGRLWAHGSFEIETAHLGRWELVQLGGKLRALGDQVTFDPVHALLGQGALQAHGSVSLAERSGAPFEFDLDVDDADAAQIVGFLGEESDRVSGRAFGKGKFAGRLEPGRRFVETADVSLDLRLEKGHLRRLPAMVVLARLPSLQGIRALFGQPLPYDTIHADLRIKDGMLRTERMLLEGPQLRIMAAGHIDLTSVSYRTDMVVALMMLQTIDRVIGQLPILRDLILGQDRSLVTVYFKLEGPWKNPTASLMPPRAVASATGWTMSVIRGGVRQLRKIFGFPPNGGGKSGGDPNAKTSPRQDP